MNHAASFRENATGASLTTNQGNPMTKQLKLLSLGLGLAACLSTAYGGIPSMNVTVFDATEKVVFKQSTGANATFSTGALPAGKYVVQFNTRSGAVKGNQYLLVVSAGQKKVIADAVAGDTLTRGGAAMKIQVGSGLQISGQVLNDEGIADASGPKFRTIDGKRYVWVREHTGTNIDGRWVDVTTAPDRTVVLWNKAELQKRMDRGGEGSMLTNHFSYTPGGY
jgi:hypothetical protein